MLALSLGALLAAAAPAATVEVVTREADRRVEELYRAFGKP